MAEAIRLVIWDLDDTFWKGTLSEGGMEYLQAAHDIVVALAKRGIMSSICSKNDLASVRPILEDSGLWDYFIFPSINWEPKGQRIAHLIADVQLRAATVLFIDDNPMNLEEAKHYVPGIQTADETSIPSLLADPRLAGKDDSGLSRLQQYKLLEIKKADEVRAGGDNVEFLRSSDIRVIFEYDVEAHLDRAIELINRTNQLNFTKKRLSEDRETARAELRELLSHYQTQAALVHVIDRYGDYGFVGFYAIRRAPKTTELIHYCFSCRTLNMGIETWLYQRLGAPKLEVVGEVLTDVINDASEVDWIEVRTDAESAHEEAAGHKFDTIVTHGGCDQRAVAHYFSAHTEQEFGEYNISRDGINYRIDHTQVLRLALEGLPEEARRDVFNLGYVESDFVTALSDLKGDNNLIILSFWMDSGIPLMRHRLTGTLIPFAEDALAKAEEKRDSPGHAKIRRTIANRFKLVGKVSDEAFGDNLRVIFAHLAGKGRVFVIKGNGQYGFTGNTWMTNKMRLNGIIDIVADEFNHVTALDITTYIKDQSEVQTPNHFDRMVYFRLYSDIMKCIDAADLPAVKPAVTVAVES